MNNNELYLMSKQKKGFLRVVFSRFAVALILIVLQVCILLTFFGWFVEYFKWLEVAETIFLIGILFYLFNMDMDATGKLTWLIMLSLFPIPAAIFLWYSKTNIGQLSLKKSVLSRIKESKDYLKQDEEILEKDDITESGTNALHNYINRSGCFPIYDNTEVTFFPLGENKFEAMLEELKKAEKYIYMEYFIVQEGHMWGQILKILAQKAKEGVDVRVMYDGMCEIVLLSSDYPKRMEKLGIKCKAFSPLTPFVSTHYNYRDHRKILVIDGKVGFNGGVNLADEYINQKVVYGHWKDTAVMLKGKAVESLTLMFLQMWNVTEDKADWKAIQNPIQVADVKADGYVMPYCDNPLDEDKVGEMVYIDILNTAKKYVHIMTPYLILDNELEMALTFAAQRGIDVKLILPGIPDKKIPYALAKSHYKKLVEAGVKIYEYTSGFVHAKVFVSDDCKGVVGTINLDYRSLYHHFECATYMYKTKCIADIEKDYQFTLSKCKEVTLETIKNEKMTYKVIGGFMKLFAPLM